MNADTVMQNIAVIGGGYVGLVTGACLANIGHAVTIIEINGEKVQKILQAQAPIAEPMLAGLLQSVLGKNLQISTDYSCIMGADIAMICVDTPSSTDGSLDTRSIRSACRSLGLALKGNTRNITVIVKSTVLPGNMDEITRPIVLETSGRSEDNTRFISNPEFLREGSAISDFMHPDRIIIGCNGNLPPDFVSRLYPGISAPVIVTDFATAEMAKYVSNAFLASKISFSNEIGNVCKRAGIDTHEIMRCVGLDHRISPHFFNAGIGFGGACFPKDIRALIRFAEDQGEATPLLDAVMAINEAQPLRIITQLEKTIGDLSQKRIAILGLAFKGQTDDVRESRAIPIIRNLLQKQAEVVCYDPLAMEKMRVLFPSLDYRESPEKALAGADACLVLTDCPEFVALNKEFNVMKQRVILEGRRILSVKDSRGICW